VSPPIPLLAAVGWLDEKLNSSPAGIAGMLVALILMVAGIVALARHAPVVVRHVAESSERAGEVGRGS
jgi:F0F1-type ATP synthase assembly protein I